MPHMSFTKILQPALLQGRDVNALYKSVLLSNIEEYKFMLLFSFYTYLILRITNLKREHTTLEYITD